MEGHVACGKLRTEMTRGSVRPNVGFTDFGLLEFFVSTARDAHMSRAGASMRRFPPRDLPDYPRSSTALLLPSDSAQAFATAEFGSALPGIVAQPPFSTNLLWSHE